MRVPVRRKVRPESWRGYSIRVRWIRRLSGLGRLLHLPKAYRIHGLGSDSNAIKILYVLREEKATSSRSSSRWRSSENIMRDSWFRFSTMLPGTMLSDPLLVIVVPLLLVAANGYLKPKESSSTTSVSIMTLKETLSGASWSLLKTAADLGLHASVEGMCSHTRDSRVGQMVLSTCPSMLVLCVRLWKICNCLLCSLLWSWLQWQTKWCILLLTGNGCSTDGRGACFHLLTALTSKGHCQLVRV